MKKRTTLHMHISTLFLVLLLLVATLIGGYGYHASRAMLESAAADLFSEITSFTGAELNGSLESAALGANILSRTGLIAASSHRERMNLLPPMQEALKHSRSMVSIYVGYPSGDMFLLRRFRTDADARQLQAPEGTRYMVQSIDHGVKPPRGRFVYLDSALNTLKDEDRPEYLANYDPRSRSWYKDALSGGEPGVGTPYVFFTTRKVGLTTFLPAENAPVVVGADIELDALSAILKQRKPTPNSHLALVNDRGQMVAHEDSTPLVRESGGKLEMQLLADSSFKVLAALAPMANAAQAGRTHSQTIELANETWHASISSVPVQGASPYRLIIATPESELMADAMLQRNRSIWLALLIGAGAIPVTIWIARRISKPIRALAGEADAIRRFDFASPSGVTSSILEVDQLAVTMDSMKQTIRRFLAITEAVATEEDFDRLLPMLLTETLAAADAQAGVLFLADGDILNPASARTCKGEDFLGALAPVRVEAAGELLVGALKDNGPRQGAMDPAQSGWLGLTDLPQATSLTSAVAVPLLNRNRQLVGAMVLMRAAPFDAAQVSFIKALSGSAASALETRELIHSQKALFEAFIQLIAGAIDAKSPYTGGHCERVPELTKMLARAACAERDGPFRDFTLTAQDWEAVHVAAWLHDCGKITTPEYVVDKATKLETIHDRLHEIRMRFEVLKRDAEIDCLKATLAGEDPQTACTRRDASLRQIDDDFDFIAVCNEGGEFMAPDKIVRLREIGSRTWMRTLDDRIGISTEERARKSRDPAPTLPVAEALLADKPEHLFERNANQRLAVDNQWGFRMPIPEMLYNKGELYNLAIQRGTLTAEERYKINEHIVQTVIMLSTLPFPKHLKEVPEIAGGHHEKMDGTGYPKKLAKGEMSVVARIMAVADIFEALTAVDRPYKKGKTLSEAVKIMSFMKKDQHIDPDLFDLFLRSGAYLEYAKRYMKAEQIDTVQIEQYVSAAAV